MAQRSVLIIEADQGFASQIAQALRPYGFEAELLPDGKEVAQAPRPTMPDLVLLCVEPKNLGYAICNKLKKNASWKDIPIVLMSAEATSETFDQHKKLKTRADEYMRKPFEMDELIEKLDALVGLGAAPGDEDAIPLDAGDGI